MKLSDFNNLQGWLSDYSNRYGFLRNMPECYKSSQKRINLKMDLIAVPLLTAGFLQRHFSTVASHSGKSYSSR
ncbi:hypothetical protein BJY01DRAFT_99186 [Aspergillus pseudoustus]|uniref:Uncharacterized protein n=1 Tax=Aspergillus pseudoustus TaxID=1810923 RepID=A0ABR4IYR0_9EURO